jgi:hypothetical protein
LDDIFVNVHVHVGGVDFFCHCRPHRRPNGRQLPVRRLSHRGDDRPGPDGLRRRLERHDGPKLRGQLFAVCLFRRRVRPRVLLRRYPVGGFRDGDRRPVRHAVRGELGFHLWRTERVDLLPARAGFEQQQ